MIVFTCNIAPLSTNSTTESSSQNRVKFTAAEDKLANFSIIDCYIVCVCVCAFLSLLVLGLDQYENNWQSIITNLLPTKTAKQVIVNNSYNKLIKYLIHTVTNSCKEFAFISHCR